MANWNDRRSQKKENLALAKAQEDEPSAARKALHIAATALGIVLCVILLPIVIVNLTLVIKSYAYPDEVPKFMGVAPLVVESGSMETYIGLDDLIFTKAVSQEELHEQDVIAYLVKPIVGPIVTHRIVGTQLNEAGETLYITRGDANNTDDDEPVAYSQVVGRYFYKVTNGGQLAMFMKEPIGMVIFVGVPLALFLLYDGLRRFFYSRKEKKKALEEIERLRSIAEGAAVPAAPEAPDASADASEMLAAVEAAVEAEWNQDAVQEEAPATAPDVPEADPESPADD